MPLPCPSDIRDAYRRDGYLILRGVFSAAEVADLAAAFDRQFQAGLTHPRSFRHGNFHVRVAEDAAIGHTVRMVQWPSYGDPVLNAFRQDGRLFRILEPLIGRDVKQIINQLHWKPSGAAGGDYAFHQDSRFRRPREAYRNLGESYLQSGIAVDPHTAESGAMRVYPGSHLLGELDLEPRGSILGSGIMEEVLERHGLDPARLVDFALEPGDVGLWHPHMIHGSAANRSGRDRRLYVNGYVAAADCDRGEWAWRDGEPVPLGEPVLVHYEELHHRPEPHYVGDPTPAPV
ncbi:phytanoyl-CoA dioxygenase family protein [Azospirillum sp. SYSU D00513]|uniref:phytanoyl-CoA dioxygenase family protein n=1 Tax=Azospirillum sp. SYSU D00513 TaxID=2812561 RepID=UPI001A95C125|nr:phytanoyl-CoA dioxygenase family protein [Azospirillum sp. SYSU D00513]